MAPYGWCLVKFSQTKNARSSLFSLPMINIINIIGRFSTFLCFHFRCFLRSVCWLKVNFFFLYFDFRFSFFDWSKVTFFTHRYTELNRLSVMLIPLASWRLVWKSVWIALSAYADRRIVLFFRNADFVVRAWITKHTSAFPAMAKESILDLTVKIMKILKIPYREMFMQWSSFKNLNHLLERKSLIIQ